MSTAKTRRQRAANPARLRRLKAALARRDAFPYFITDLVNIRYLTGFTGSHAYLLVDRNRSWFISDGRYEEYARSILPPSISFVLQGTDFFAALGAILAGQGRRTLHLEVHALTLSLHLEMKRRLRGVRLVPAGDEVNHIRMVKDDDEIALVRAACRLTDRCYEHLKSIIRPGVTEWDVSVAIEHFYRTHGATRSAFDSIVAAGAGSSMPHYATAPGTRTIRKGDVVLIDMGCVYQGYNSDLTRTVFVGRVDPVLERIYRIVRLAQESACRAVRPGVTVGALDAVARGVIDAAGFGDRFGHSLGHGVGLDIHELPAVRPGDAIIKKNMTITIEPGIYLPGVGGVRIEDTVLVTANGHERLTTSSKDITIV